MTYIIISAQNFNMNKDIMNKVGNDVVQFMKAFLVANDKIKTGKLKDSIEYELIESGDDKTTIRISFLPYMGKEGAPIINRNQVDQGMIVVPYSHAPSYINRLKYKGANVPSTDIYQNTKDYIKVVLIPEIAEAARQDISDMIENLFKQ
jgi:hypothetical protein